MNTRNKNRKHRAARVRSRIAGTATRPRLVVFRSLNSFSAQLIDDASGKTLASGSLEDTKGAKNTVEGVEKFGATFGKTCASQKIEQVVFDRAGYQYHGKVKAFAEAVREAGVKF